MVKPFQPLAVVIVRAVAESLLPVGAYAPIVAWLAISRRFAADTPDAMSPFTEVLTCAVAVSPKVKKSVGAVAVAGFSFTELNTVNVSMSSTNAFIVKVAAVVESDLPKVAVPAVTVSVGVAVNSAFEGTALKIPSPKDATATSAIRLKFVFVDIYFLSLVVTRNFLVAASR